MGLAGKDDLNRPVRVGEQGVEPVDFREEQSRPLVGGESTGKADGQNIRIEHATGRFHRLVALAAPAALPRQASPHELQQEVFQGVMRLPEFAWINLVDLLPDIRLSHPPNPAGREDAVIQLQHLPREPTRHVDTVGDVPDRHFLFNPRRPKARPHPSADMAMQGADGVGPPRQLEAEHCHAEWLVMVVRLNPAHSHQVFMGDAEGVAGRPEMLFDQAPVKSVMARWHGGVSGKDRLPGYLANRLIERIAIPLHSAPYGLKGRKGRMAFVEMVDAGNDAHCPDRLHATNTKDHFLPDAGPAITAIEAAGQLTVLWLVALDVAVEQEQLHPAHCHLPDLGLNRTRAGIDRHHNRLAIRIDSWLQR